jgi:hypothetical protein
MRRGLAASCLLTAAVCFLPFVRGTMAGNAFYFRDLSRQFFPLRRFLLEGLRQGELRYWCPLVNEGVPSPFPPLAYPLQLLELLAPTERGLSLQLALHVPLAGIAFLLLARALGAGLLPASAGAVVYALGGFGLSTLNLYVYAHALAWAPLLAWALCRAMQGGWREAVPAAVVGGIAISTGGIELVAQASLLGVVLGARRARLGSGLGRAAAALVLGAALAAPSIAAAFNALEGSARARGFSTDVALAQSVHPLTLVQVVVASWYGDPNDLANQWWGENFFPLGFPYVLSLYLGALALCLAAVGWRYGPPPGRRLAVLALAAAVLSLGRWVGLHAVVEELPLLRAFRFPVKAFFTVHVSVALLVSLGLTALQAGERRPWRRLAAAAAALAASLGLLAAAPRLAPEPTRWFLWGFMPWGYQWPHRYEALGRISADAWTAAGLTAGAGLAALLVLRGRLRPRLAALACAGLVAADMLRTGSGLNPMVEPSFYRLSDEMAARVSVLGGRARIYSCDPMDSPAYFRARARSGDRHEVWTFALHQELLVPFTNLPYGVAGAYGQDLTSLVPVDRAAAPGESCRRFSAIAPRLREAAVGYVLALEPVRDPGLRLVDAATPPRIAPLAVHVHALSDPAPWAALVAAGGAATPVALERRASGSMRARVSAPGEGTLLVREGYARGWTARLDGVAVPVHREAGRYLGVRVPAGLHDVALAYRPPGLRAALAVSLVAALLLGLLWRRSGRELTRLRRDRRLGAA